MTRTGNVLSIFSTKGGVGKTTLAINLAAAFQHVMGLKTALVSLSTADLDASALLGHSEIQVAKGPFTATSLPIALAQLRASTAYTIIDAGSVFNDLAGAAFEHSNLILLVTTPDLNAIYHANHVLKSVEARQLPLRMVKVVLNRAESRGNFRSTEVRESLPLEIIAEIPSDGRTVGLSMNQSTPFVLMEPKARVSQAMRAFAKWLTDHPAVFVQSVAGKSASGPAASGVAGAATQGGGDGAAVSARAAQDLIALRQRVHSQLIEQLDLKRLDLKAINDPHIATEIKQRIEQAILDLIVKERGVLPSPLERATLVKELVDEAIGLGPLEDLVADPEVSDILVNGYEMIYVEKRGKLSLTDKRFLSNEQVRTVIERIIAPLGRRIDESSPMVDARLSDGSRINAIIPPLSVKGPILSIRKFARGRYTIEDLVTFGTLTTGMAEFLRLCVLARRNIIVSGGTGSGKTTLLNVLSFFIPEDERIITIEDAAELRVAQRHWVPLEARMPNVEGRGEITIRQLFRNALRMRPDRIIIGECRGDETLDMLQAMNTGHDGSLTTLHANSPQDVIIRMDSLVLMSNVNLPVRAVREQIASAIALVIHTARFPDGSRKVTHITELTGIDEQTSVTFADIFVFRQTGVGPRGEVVGAFEPTGYLPSFLSDLRAKGFVIDERVFRPQEQHVI